MQAELRVVVNAEMPDGEIVEVELYAPFAGWLCAWSNEQISTYVHEWLDDPAVNTPEDFRKQIEDQIC